MTTLHRIREGTIYLSLVSAKVCLRGWLGRAVVLCAALVGMGGAQALGQAAQPVIVADFNRDGIPDALVQSTSTPTATIAFGSVPYGTFGGNATAVTFPAACTSLPVGSLAVGDFNGDGYADIAFFCGTTAGTMLGNGDGTFGPATTLAGVASSSGIVGDFNKDGKLDIVVLSTFSTNNGTFQSIQFLAGNGDGTFNEAVLSNLAVSTYTTMVAADLNGDGYPDLALINTPTDGTPTLEILGNNQNGTFGAGNQGVFSANTTGTVATTGTTAILVGSFFGAATTDLVVAATGQSGQLFAFQNASTATAFSLNAPVTTAAAGLTGAATGRFTGSGFNDVAASNGTNIAVLANDGKANFAGTYATLTLASTSSLFAVADSNGDGYADLYTAVVPDAGGLQLAVNLTSGSATATSQPFSLAVGSRAISATWAGNVNFTGSAPTGTQMVVGVASATTLVSSKNPSLVGDSVTFSGTVAPAMSSDLTPTGSVVLTDGSTMLGTSPLDGSGNYTYTTSALTQGTQAIMATYSGDAVYAVSSATLSQVVVGTTVSSLTPTTATLGSGATTVTATGTGFTSTTVVQVNGTAIPTTLVSPTTLTAVIPASDFTSVGTLQITVVDPSVSFTSPPVTFTVTAPVPSAVLTAPPTTAPGTQPAIDFTLSKPYPVAITVTLTLQFAASTTPPVDDPSIQFSTGGRTLTFVVPANTVTVPAITLQAGTVAGTITVATTLTAGGANITPASLTPAVIVVPAAVPTISGVTVTRSGDQLTVVMHGFSNTREMVSAQFHFTAAAGATLETTDLTITADTIFNTNWFQTTASDQYGSTFTYTQIFNTSDAATTVGSVEVTLTNTVGASAMMTTQ
jgi:hypothetical protein